MRDADEPGVYQLHLCLPKTRRIEVGKLGTFTFPEGHYIYTGSAMSGLERRLARHRRREKTLHWHIDYLLCHARIEVIAVWRTTERRECALNAEMLARPGARVIIRGFGSSDCRCETHLVYLERGDWKDDRSHLTCCCAGGARSRDACGEGDAPGNEPAPERRL